jgi:hypothetical protein
MRWLIVPCCPDPECLLSVVRPVRFRVQSVFVIFPGTDHASTGIRYPQQKPTILRSRIDGLPLRGHRSTAAFFAMLFAFFMCRSQ